MTQAFLSYLKRSLIHLCWLVACGLGASAQAVTYANTTATFNWIDASTHAKLGYKTAPYKFNGLSGCGTTPPILDDTISDQIPIGFNFTYGGRVFNALRVVSNGRVQFNSNVTCGYGSPVQQMPYPDAGLNYTMRIYGNDLDPTSKVDLSRYNTNCVSKVRCYVSYATIGNAPDRRFVVTWNNVPEWTTGANPTGSYSLQLILQENGEFIYQYGSDVPGPSAALGQVGWQVDTNDYDTPKTGFPATNSAIKYYIPRPVGEYLMEQALWTSAPGQVIDTSGGGNSGAALGGAQTISTGKVCRAANIPLNTSAATTDAINTGIKVPQSAGGAGTVTFWYKANTAWSGGTARDAQLLDATLVNNQWFFLTRRSNGHLRFVVTDSLGKVWAAETAAISVAAATWKHIAVSWNFNALVASNSDHLRIYADGVLQLELPFSTSGVLSSQIGSLYLGDSRGGIVGSSGTGNSMDGVLDEVRVYNYEGGLALVQRDMNLSLGGCINHYAITDAGTGLSCQQTTVTVTAHDINHGNYTMPNNTTQVNLTTSTGVGDWSLISGYGLFDNGVANDGKATYLFNGEYQAVFGLNYTSAATVTAHVSDGQFSDQENQAIVVKACAIAKFNACEVATPRCVPSGSSSAYALLNTKLANTAFKLDLVKLKNDATLETTFNGTATVELLVNSAANTPLDANNCPLTSTATIPLGSVTFANGYPAAATGVPVSATAIAAVTPKFAVYREARVRVTCNAANCGTANIACSTDSFAVRPLGFTVTSNMTSTGQASTDTPSLNAGAAFTLRATASATTPGVTAALGYDGIPFIDSSLAGQKIYTHVGQGDFTSRLGDSAGSTPGLISMGAASAATGIATRTSVKYDDVGNFGILAGGVSDSKFTQVDQPGGQSAGCIVGSASNTADSGGKFGCNIGSTITPLFGRFYPDHFDMTSYLDAVCGTGAASFTYMGQPELGVSMSVAAASVNGVVLNHYSSSTYPTLVGIDFNGDDNNGATSFAPLNSRLTPAVPAFVWVNGKSGRAYSTDAAGYAAGATTLTLNGTGAVAVGDFVRFDGDPNKYSVTGIAYVPSPTSIDSAATDALLSIAAPGLLQAMPSTATVMTVLHSFNRLGSKAAPVPDGPYEAFSLKAALNNNPENLQFASVNGHAMSRSSVAQSSTTRLRYGRLQIENAYGSELLDLPLKMTARYYNGSAYVLNTLDNCTNITSANFTATALKGAVVATVAKNNLVGTGPVTLVGGKIPDGSGFKLAKPNPLPAGKGSVKLSTSNGGLYPVDDFLPGVSTATFGIYRSGPVIFVREMY